MNFNDTAGYLYANIPQVLFGCDDNVVKPKGIVIIIVPSVPPPKTLGLKAQKIYPKRMAIIKDQGRKGILWK